MRPALRRLPILLGMALLVAPWAVVAANAVAGWLAPGTLVWRSPPLLGVQAAAPWPGLGAGSVWEGRYQRQATAAFSLGMPLLPEAVGLKNQIYWSLLRQSGVAGVEVGQRRRLFEEIYLREYCHRDVAAVADRMERWAADIARLEHWYAERGRVFVYVITPSKAAVYPQYLPPSYPCPAAAADRTGLLPALDAALDRHGVHYVDAASMTAAAAHDYPVDVFPRGGTHWGEIASTLAAQAVVRLVNAQAGRKLLPSFSFTWRRSPPHGIDRDLTDLLNLPYPSLDYPTAAVTIDAAAPAACHPLDIAAVGGSFTYELLWALLKLPCPPTIAYYNYLQIEQALYPGDIRGPVNVAQRDDELLHKATIVVLEENETIAARSVHGPALYRLVMGEERGSGHLD